MVEQVTTLLREGVPQQIVIADIEAFFESIPRDKIVSDLMADWRISYDTKQLLDRLFSHPAISKLEGLPRGLSVSTTLSELYVSSLDSYIRSLSGVYFFARYVDDIVVFATSSGDEIKSEIDGQLRRLGLQANTKGDIIPVRCRCAIGCSCGSKECRCAMECKCSENDGAITGFDYLGYSFKFSETPARRVSGQPRKVTLGIASKKKRKIKTRIILALKDYCVTQDFELLRRRFKFLTGNYPVSRSGAKAKLFGGFYFNYRQIESGHEDILELDDFLGSAVFSRKGTLGQALKGKLTRKQRTSLARISFAAGHRMKIVHDFKKGDIYSIRRCLS